MSKPETWKSWQGRLVEGKFPLRQWLGGSDHSAVFLTDLTGSGAQKAAIKLVQAESSKADGQLARLRATLKLSHPNLLRGYEAGAWQIDGSSGNYVVMEYAEEDLSQILPQRALEPAEVSEMLPPLLDALSYVHQNGFVHGSLKPSNVLAVGDQLKLSSDGAIPFAETVTEKDPLRRRRDAYDAPETAAGVLSPASDVWSLGMTTVAALTQKTAEGVPESLSEPFRQIARECLQLDPQQRCSIAQIKAKLQSKPEAVANHTVTSTAVATPPVREHEPARAAGPTPRRPRPFLVTLSLAVVLVLIMGVFYWKGKSAANQNSTAPQRPTEQQSPTTSAPAPVPIEQPKQSSEGEPSHQVTPDVPSSARRTIRGTIKVVVRVQVDASGKVTAASFKSAGSSRYFAGLAMKAAQGWEFSPPVVNGTPQESSWLLQFRFTRSGTQVSARRERR